MPLRAVRPSYKPQYFAAQTPNFKQVTVPSPNKGLDLSTPLTDQDQRSAVVLENFLCRRIGVELRKGSLRWTTNLGGSGSLAKIVTLMSYHPPRDAGAVYLARQFAACDDGKIYDITGQTPESFVPIASVTIPGQLSPGRFSWTNISTAGTNYLCICTAGGGYWTFDHTGGWVNRTAFITPSPTFGPVPAIDFDFVISWKNRLWFIVNNKAEAFFLPPTSIQGIGSGFDFGALLVNGGSLAAMASWTLDGGDGIDDKLVLVGSEGDVLVYDGTDPTSIATFKIVGRWYTGRPPDGRRFMSPYGGDLYLITEVGIEYMTNLLRGQGLLDSAAANAGDPSRRFNEIIGREVRDSRGDQFWKLISLTREEGVVIQTPYSYGSQAHQYFFGVLSHGWSKLTGWPATAMNNFQGELYYGTVDGKVCKAFTGDTDDELVDGTIGVTPKWELQSAFVAPNEDRVSLKRPQLVRVVFQGPSPPEVKLQVNTEWSTVSVPGTPPIALPSEAKWDLATWDLSTWGSDINAYSVWVGTEGLGVYFSLRMSVRGVPGTLFNSWSITYEGGGLM